MASFTQILKRKRKRRQKAAGHKRKVRESRQSTLSYAELFAMCGEPGQPAPKLDEPGSSPSSGQKTAS